MKTVDGEVYLGQWEHCVWKKMLFVKSLFSNSASATKTVFTHLCLVGAEAYRQILQTCLHDCDPLEKNGK